MKIKKGKKGFTLIETLIVVAIIGILATLMLVSYAHSLKKGRDARRVSDIESVKLACNMYADKTGGYPDDAEGFAGLDSQLEDYINIDAINDPQDSAPPYTYEQVDGSNCELTYYSEVEETSKTVECKD
ncbi:MAG: type II secretion system protein [Patescibacteria group bacterium]|nr:type II secretion system protein [Patescibacteria group bacterium]